MSQRPAAVIAVAIVLAVVGGWTAASRLVLDADTNHLIAPDRPFMAGFEAWIEEFGDLERLVVVVDAADEDTAREVVREIVLRLDDRPDLPEVHGWISAEDGWRLAPWAIPESELRSLVSAADGLALLAGDASTAAILEQGIDRLQRLVEPSAIALSDTARRDLGASGLVLLGVIASAADELATPEAAGTLPTNPVALGIRPADTLLAAPGGRLRFIEILPRKEFGSLAAIAEPLAAIRDVVSTVAAAHPGVDIGVTGKPVLQADELATSDADMTRCAAAALAIIALIFVRTFRGWRRPLLMVVAFAIAFGWTYGVATLLVGRLNLLSIVFMLVLVGVGLDYGVHVVTRWQASRGGGASIEDAVRETMATAGRGNLFGAATSAGVFLLAVTTDFGGLRELGLIAGTGLLCCVIAMNIVLPALLVATERRWTGPSVTTPDPEMIGRHGISRHGSGLPTAAVVIAALGSIALGVVIARHARFQDNLLELQAEGLDSVVWEHRVLADAASASWFAASIHDSIEEVESLVAAAATRPEIGMVRSVLDVVPPITQTRRELLATFVERTTPTMIDESSTITLNTTAIVRARELASRVADLARSVDPRASEEFAAIASRLKSLAGEMAYAPDVPPDVEHAITTARTVAGEAVRAMRVGAAGDLRMALPPAIRDRLIAPSGRFMVSLIPAEDIWSPEPMARFVEAIRTIDPDVTGVPITQYESLRDMRRSFLDMALLAAVLVAALVWLDFRSVGRTVAVMTVLAVGLLWTIGIATLLDVHLNVANFFAIPILIGLGVDSAIHLLHRLDECGDGPIDLGATRRAVVLTAVTTGIGFGSLIFARHRGLASLGVVMAVGSLCCLAATLVLLPALTRIAPPRSS